MTTIFAIGTFWFWALLVVGFITITFFVEKKNNSGWMAFWSVLVLGLILYWFGSRETIQEMLRYASHHPMRIVAAVIGYFVVGTGWSIVKWYFYLKGRQRTGDWPMDYVPAQGEPKGSWAPSERIKVPIKAKDHRDDILMWMSWWPFSALWTIINDPVRKAFEWIFDQMERTFDRISERIFKGDRP